MRLGRSRHAAHQHAPQIAARAGKALEIVECGVLEMLGGGGLRAAAWGTAHASQSKRRWAACRRRGRRILCGRSMVSGVVLGPGSGAARPPTRHGELARVLDALRSRGAPLSQGGDADHRGAGGDHLAVPRDFSPGLRRAAAHVAGRSLCRVPGAGAHHDGDGAERLRQYLLVADDRQDPGQHRRHADAALEPGRAHLGLCAGRRDARPSSSAWSSARRCWSSCRCTSPSPAFVLFHAVAASLLLSVSAWSARSGPTNSTTSPP